MKTIGSDEVLEVLREIMHRADMRSRRLLREIGLSSTQAGVLHALRDGEPRGAGELAKGLSMTGATLTGVLDRLEQRGYLTRMRGDVDKRKVAVRISEEGLARLGEIPERFHDHFQQEFNQLPEADRKRIHAALREVAGLFGPLDPPAQEQEDAAATAVVFPVFVS